VACAVDGDEGGPDGDEPPRSLELHQRPERIHRPMGEERRRPELLEMCRARLIRATWRVERIENSSASAPAARPRPCSPDVLHGLPPTAIPRNAAKHMQRGPAPGRGALGMQGPSGEPDIRKIASQAAAPERQRRRQATRSGAVQLPPAPCVRTRPPGGRRR
jgi:hypothetical protein